MRMLMMLVLMLTFVGLTNAGVWVVDDFESYADDTALQAAWAMNTGSNIQGETLENVLNGQSMLIENNNSSPYYAQTKYALPGAVFNDHGVNLTSAGYDAITLTFAIPAKNLGGSWDYLDGSGGQVFLSLYDCWGGKVLEAAYGGGVTPSGTGWSNGIVWEIDFAGHTISGANLENVEKITLGVKNTYYDYGGLFIDDVVFVPEPATITMLGFGAFALLRRRRK